MQAESEIWTTALFNRFLAGPLDSLLKAIGHPAADPAHPWPNWMTTELLVVAIILVLFAILRSRLSVEKPGSLQLSFEAVYKFVEGQASESIDHHVNRYVSFFGTIFIFILFMNLIGIIPGLESPTMTAVGSARVRGGGLLLLSLDGHSRAWYRQVPAPLCGSRTGGWPR